MNANEKRISARDKYRTILGRNKYSQDLRTYVNTKYKDGKYYSDCSSSVCWALRETGYPITYNKSSLPSTVGIYNSKDVVEVPVKINSKGEITNPEVLRIADCLLFAGTDTSRSGSGYVGHVEMVGEIDGSKITIYGHGSGTPRKTEMQAYLRKRRSQSSPTKLGHRGLIKVVRRIADDGSEPVYDPDDLRNGDTGAAVRDLQTRLIALGISCGPDGADGDFGPNTEAAVKEFQRKNGLPETGVYDAATRKALTGEDSGSTPAQPTTGRRVVISNCKSANIRTGPGQEFADVGDCFPGDTFAAVEIEGWVPVQIDKQVRWISAKYARVEG